VGALGLAYFQQPDVVELARDLVGKQLFTSVDGELTGGTITETEAYAAPEDKASHAYGNRRTKRTEVMFHTGGKAYVYLCYGIHALFNIVTNVEGVPHAILIRAIEPTHGIEVMERRRGRQPLASGPGKLTQALGITLEHNGLPLQEIIWLEEGNTPAKVHASPRIGIDYAADWKDRPWRFYT